MTKQKPRRNGLNPACRRPFSKQAAGGSQERGSGLDGQLLAEDVAGRVHLEALHPLVVVGEQRPPERLNDRAVLLQDLLELADDLGPGSHVERPLGLAEQLIELLVGVFRLVPRYAGPVGKGQHHEGEWSMGPDGEAEWDGGPDIPVLGRWQNVDLAADPGGLPLLDHSFDGRALPGRIRLAEDLDVDAVLVAGLL